MAFKVRTDEINHSPQWYEDHCSDEDGGSPSFRKLLKTDMQFIDADIEKGMKYEELIGNYRETWDAIMRGADEGASPADLAKALEREALAGYRPNEQYSKPPFSSIVRLMKKHELSTTDLGVFLKWKAKDDNLKAARAATATKRKKSSKDDLPLTLEPFFVTSRRKRPLPEL